MKANIHTAIPHRGDVQRGKDFDLVFDYNDNTKFYWDCFEEQGCENSFPSWVEDWNGFLFFLMDFLENWSYEKVKDSNSSLVLITKNGKYISSEYFEDYNDFMSAIKPFSKNHFAAAIFNDFGEEYFWVNGENGVYALQEYTGWFDFDIYNDWI